MGLTLNQLMEHLLNKTPFLVYGDPVVFDPAVEASCLPHEWYRQKIHHALIAVNVEELGSDRHQLGAVHELLAVLHGDGGHYEQEHGLEQAVKDAVEIVNLSRSITDDNEHLRAKLAARDEACQSMGICYLKLRVNDDLALTKIVATIGEQFVAAGYAFEAEQAKIIEAAIIFDRAERSGMLSLENDTP